MEELMIHVEKIVRPLRILPKQKGCIREELLNHLTEIYEEELERQGESELALKTAFKRFGKADEISDQLYDSLPWYSNVLSYIPMLAPVRSWPMTTGMIIQRAWLTGMLLWLVVGIPWCGILISTGRKSVGNATATWIILGIFGLLELVMAIGIFGAMHGTYGQRKSIWRTIIFALGGCTGLVITTALLQQFVNPDLPHIVYAISLLMPLFMIMLAAIPAFKNLIYHDQERMKRAGEWNQLIILDE